MEYPLTVKVADQMGSDGSDEHFEPRLQDHTVQPRAARRRAAVDYIVGLDFARS